MEINTSNLYNKDILQTNKFENINQDKLSLVEDKKLREVSNEFEAFFLNQILSTSLQGNNTIAGSGAGSDIIKGMYLESIANHSSGTFGISDMLYNFLSQNNKKEQVL
ncbi:rod-binding protein [Aliarcobacter skirrowii]|uniref:rod-binding protein n=1 Tax=Aliarcobacter skirrowii TaxID=28200 RepID=UPI0029BD4A39|nr:rod-binding protein [Aliarcobacter skirrowii]MDX4050593.1 rod-binding protein [Aliarcobacter skirrowii]